MEDKALIFINLFSFIFFITMLIMLVRIRGQTGILWWMQRIFLGVVIISSIAVWYIFRDLSVDNKIILLLANFFLTGALSFAYIVGLLGPPLTSLRIELLMTIVRAGRDGIRKEDLDKLYTKPSLIRRRLFRLETSGEIVKIGDRYKLRSASRYFIIHTFLLAGLLMLYQPFRGDKNIQ